MEYFFRSTPSSKFIRGYINISVVKTALWKRAKKTEASTVSDFFASTSM